MRTFLANLTWLPQTIRSISMILATILLGSYANGVSAQDPFGGFNDPFDDSYGDMRGQSGYGGEAYGSGGYGAEGYGSEGYGSDGYGADGYGGEGDEPMSEEEQAEAERKARRMEKIQRLRFDRRPSTILKLWSSRAQLAKQEEQRKRAEVRPPSPKTTRTSDNLFNTSRSEDASQADGATVSVITSSNSEQEAGSPVTEAVDGTAPATTNPATTDPQSLAAQSADPQASTATQETNEGLEDSTAEASGKKGAETNTSNVSGADATAESDVTEETGATAEADAEEETNEVEDAEAAAEAERLAEEEAKAKALAEAMAIKEFEELLKSMTEAVTLGEWGLLKEAMADRERISEDEAMAVFDAMVAQLGVEVAMDFSQVEGLSEEMRDFLDSMLMNQRNYNMQELSERQVINFADLLGMLEAAPVELKDDQVTAFSRLVRLTLETGNQLDDLVASLREQTDLSQQKVALLLSASGQDQYTLDFLPTPTEAIATSNHQALNLLARHHMALYRKDEKETDREQAWKLTLAVLDLELPPIVNDPLVSMAAEDAEELTSDEKKEIRKLTKEKRAVRDAAVQDRALALARAVSLAPKLRAEFGRQWLQESFTKYPERGQEILAKIGTETAQLLAQTPHDAQRRARNLELQHAAVEEFFAANTEVDSSWKGILSLLANNWLQEASVSHRYSEDESYDEGMRRDRYGNIYYSDLMEDSYGGEGYGGYSEIAAVKVSKVLETAPTDGWLAAVDSSMQPQFTLVRCRLWLKINEDAKAFPLIEELARTHPAEARELANDFLRVWTRNHNPNVEQERTNYYMYMYGYEERAESIPLTRSKQNRNLEELTHWLKRLKALPIEGTIDEQLLVQAFMTCHSVAEVYDVDDIERVFGAFGSVGAGTMANLIQQMRSNLSGLWRDPNVQRDSKTKRKKQEIYAEVARGYQVAQGVLKQALQQYPDDWQLLLTQATIAHDENDFLQEIDPSSDFTSRRNSAFERFAAAAGAYIEIAPTLPARDQKNDVFDYWFYAALGATEIGAISEHNQPAKEQFDAIRAALAKLTGELGKRHRDRFATALFSRMSAVNPACKFRYLEGGFALVGDNPQALEARKVYDYYHDLVTELELVARLDGDSAVGHQEPFGVYIDLRHTKELERESGGFAKYLQNQNNAYYAYNYGRPTENYRDKFQDAATAALQEHFDVLSITFNHGEVKSVSDGPVGWRVTPYAYLLLKARGPQVDKVPSLKMDLDFLDTSGYVSLPIGSAPLSIDATQTTSNRLPEDLEIVQLVDERQAANGKLIVESKATAHGLIPPLEQILDTNVQGFELNSIADTGVSVVELDKEQSRPTIISERTWTLEFQASNPNIPTPNEFSFPAPVFDDAKCTYQRYVDADLEEVAATFALTEEYGSNRQQLMLAGLLVGACLVVAVGVILLITRQRPEQSTATRSQERPLTPFAVLSRLKALDRDAQLPADSQQRLRTDIATLEQYYFSQSNGHSEPDLDRLMARWN